jgi:hypothetical protein
VAAALALLGMAAHADCTPANNLVAPHTRATWSEGGVVYDTSTDELKTCDGTNYNTVGGGGGGLYNVTAYTASTTWTKPSGVSKVRVLLVGGGGGGGGGTSSYGPSGGGGGGGAFAESFFDVTSIASATITVGAAGVTAGGGSGGTKGTVGVDTGGAGGTASGTKIFSVSGGRGHNPSTTSQKGDGGDSYYGTGGRGGDYTTFPGFAATGYGGGGGGASVGTASAGGVGTAGIVIVYEYY